MSSNELYKCITKIFPDKHGDNFNLFKELLSSAIIAVQKWWKGEGPFTSSDKLDEVQGIIEKISENVSKYYGKECSYVVKDFLRRLLINKYYNKLLNEHVPHIKFNEYNYINVHPSPNFLSLMGLLLVSILNPNNIVEEVSPVTTVMEREAINIFSREFLKSNNENVGFIVSGGTIANLMALLLARDKTIEQLNDPITIFESKEYGGWSGKEGIFREKRIMVLTTANYHYSIKKALWILGLGDKSLIVTPVAIDESIRRREDFYRDIISNYDERLEELEVFYSGEMAPFSLQPIVDIMLYSIRRAVQNDFPIMAAVLTFGSTESGILERGDRSLNGTLIELLKKEYLNHSGLDLWVHVDAAIGGFALPVSKVKARAEELGINYADSITVDPHKLGYLPYPAGMIIFKRRKYLEILYQSAPYLEGIAPTIEGSRPGSNVAATWLSLRALGSSGYKYILEKLIKITEEFSEDIYERSSYLLQPLHPVELNVVTITLFREGASRRRLNKMVFELYKSINKNKKFYINKITDLSNIKVCNDMKFKLSGSCELEDIYAIRIFFMHPYITDEIIEEFAEEVVFHLRKLLT